MRRTQPAATSWSKSMSEIGPTSVRPRRRWRMISWPASNGMSASSAVPMHTDAPSGTKLATASCMEQSLSSGTRPYYSSALTIVRRRSAKLLSHWLQIQRDRSLSDLAAEYQPVLARTAEVNARVHTGIRALSGRLREAGERPRDALERLAARDREADLITEDSGKRHGGRAAEGALRRRIVRDRGRVLMAVPGRIADGGIVAIVVALANRRDGAPEVVHVADLEAGDIGIRHREIHEREKPRGVPGIEILGPSDGPSDPVPGSGAFEPEPRYLRLVL